MLIIQHGASGRGEHFSKKGYVNDPAMGKREGGSREEGALLSTFLRAVVWCRKSRVSLPFLSAKGTICRQSQSIGCIVSPAVFVSGVALPFHRAKSIRPAAADMPNAA